MLLLGGLYGLGSLALLAVGGMTFLGATGIQSAESQMIQGIGVLQAVSGGLALLPAALLVRAGIAALVATHEPDAVARSLRAQLWFWRVLAVYVLGSTLLYALLFFTAVAVGVFAGL